VRTRTSLIPVFAAAIIMATPALAGTRSFDAVFRNTNPPAAPGGRCAALTVSIANLNSALYATGTSNLGDFTSTQSHCLNAGPPIAVGAPDTPYYDGRFTYSFANGSTLSGTYTGLLTNAGRVGVIDNAQNFVVTGGSGLFAHARGAFSGTGTIRFAGGPPAAELTIRNATVAVPEPATWGLMIAGFATVGAVARARRVGGVAVAA